VQLPPAYEPSLDKRKGLTLELAPDPILGMGARKAVTEAVKIGEAAKEAGLSVDTIRFYEKEGLLKRSTRTEGGFRVFGPGEIHVLKFIREAQTLGFSCKRFENSSSCRETGLSPASMSANCSNRRSRASEARLKNGEGYRKASTEPCVNASGFWERQDRHMKEDVRCSKNSAP
jgi:DNA-binding transcriptional MerR regulator